MVSIKPQSSNKFISTGLQIKHHAPNTQIILDSQETAHDGKRFHSASKAKHEKFFSVLLKKKSLSISG